MDLFPFLEKEADKTAKSMEFDGLLFLYIVKWETKQLKTSAWQNNAVFFIQKHLYTAKNTCMFRKTIVDCIRCV